MESCSRGASPTILILFNFTCESVRRPWLLTRRLLLKCMVQSLHNHLMPLERTERQVARKHPTGTLRNPKLVIQAEQEGSDGIHSKILSCWARSNKEATGRQASVQLHVFLLHKVSQWVLQPDQEFSFHLENATCHYFDSVVPQATVMNMKSMMKFANSPSEFLTQMRLDTVPVPSGTCPVTSARPSSPRPCWVCPCSSSLLSSFAVSGITVMLILNCVSLFRFRIYELVSDKLETNSPMHLTSVDLKSAWFWQSVLDQHRFYWRHRCSSVVTSSFMQNHCDRLQQTDKDRNKDLDIIAK